MHEDNGYKLSVIFFFIYLPHKNKYINKFYYERNEYNGFL